MEYVVQNMNTGASVALFASDETEARIYACLFNPRWSGCWLVIRPVIRKVEEELSDVADDLSDWGDGW